MPLNASYSGPGITVMVSMSIYHHHPHVKADRPNKMTINVGYYTDFSVSRYKRGLHCSEFVQLMKYFDLQDITMTRLYARPPEEAIIILGDIMDADRNSASQYALQYLRISAAITNTDLRVQSLRYLVHHDALKSTGNYLSI